MSVFNKAWQRKLEASLCRLSPKVLMMSRKYKSPLVFNGQSLSLWVMSFSDDQPLEANEMCV